MIYIKESFVSHDTVEFKVDGILDSQSIPILKNACEVHLKADKKVLLVLDGLIHISREGRDFLHEIRNKVIIANIPQFVRLETQD